MKRDPLLHRRTEYFFRRTLWARSVCPVASLGWARLALYIYLYPGGVAAAKQAILPGLSDEARHRQAPNAPTPPVAVAGAAGAAWVDLGLQHYQRGMYTQAEAAFHHALIIDPTWHVAHLTLGKIYLLRGLAGASDVHMQKARAHLRVAVRLRPSDGRADRFLSLLINP